MKFSLLTLLVSTALGVLFTACILAKTRDASETLVLFTRGINLLILMQIICVVLYSRGRNAFATGYGIAYLVLELTELLDGAPFASQVTYKLDLWIRYFLPSYTTPDVWNSRQASVAIVMQILFCVVGGLIADLSQKHARKHL